MANYSSLKSTIDSNVRTNGTEAITGAVLNTVLNAMVNSLGAGYQYMGVAIPSTNPGTPDQNVFYIAGTEGTYTNFGGIVVANEVAALVWNGSWSKQNTGIKFVSVSQNISTGHTDINIGSDSYPVASVEEVNQLGQETGKIIGIQSYNHAVSIVKDKGIDPYGAIVDVQGISYFVCLLNENDTTLSLVSDKRSVYVGWYFDYPTIFSFIRRDSWVNGIDIPAGAKFAIVQFLGYPSYAFINNANNAYISAFNDFLLNSVSIAEKMIDNGAYNAVFDILENKSLTANGRIQDTTNVYLLPIKLVPGRKLELETDKSIYYICFYTENPLVNDGSVIGERVSFYYGMDVPNDSKYALIQYLEKPSYCYPYKESRYNYRYRLLNNSAILPDGNITYSASGVYLLQYFLQNEIDYFRMICDARISYIAWYSDTPSSASIIGNRGNYNSRGIPPQNAKYVVVQMQENPTFVYVSFEQPKTLKEKIIAFAGDSITYGYDDAHGGQQLPNPWVSQVGDKLNVINCINYGVSSASVMPVTGTPFALSTGYVDFNNDIDILGVMIGINDAFRAYNGNVEYVLGTMEDRNTSTFYGALHTMWQGLLAKYPPSSGKKLFMLAYFGYTSIGDFWDAWEKAQRDVAEYYAIPICDMRKELGISQNMPVSLGMDYWAVNPETQKYSAHPKQAGANVIADFVSNWVNREFSI